MREYVAGVKKKCGSLWSAGNSVTNNRSNPHGGYSDGKFCNRASLQYQSQLEYK